MLYNSLPSAKLASQSATVFAFPLDTTYFYNPISLKHIPKCIN